MWNFGYHLSRLRGDFVRGKYARSLARVAKRRIAITRPINLDLFSYSGEAALPEQVASIRTFLQNVGRPARIMIASDGSHSEASRELLRSIDHSVEVIDVPNNVGASLFAAYLREHPTGKQLALIMSLPHQRPALYVDSDVLFFRGASRLHDLVTNAAAPALYLADCKFSGDDRLLITADEQNAPVNTGVALLFRSLDWSIAADRFAMLNGTAPTFFTNQTLTHLAMHANSAQPLDASKFVLQLDDQFVFADRYAGSHIALRHYVNPVRHKFWTTLARAQ